VTAEYGVTADDPSAAWAPPTRPPSLHVQGLAFAYPDGHQALHGVDLRIEPGERVALLGPNGAGKTTLVLHLNGILRAGAGSVAVGGLPVAPAHLKEIRRRVGIVFQDPDDQLFMPTVGDDVAFGPANFGVAGAALRERVDAALAAVDMLAYRDRSPLHLSGGQRRRVVDRSTATRLSRSARVGAFRLVAGLFLAQVRRPRRHVEHLAFLVADALRFHRRAQLVLPAGHDVAVAGDHRVVADLRDVAGSSFFDCPTLVSSMSARAKKSVSVAPGIRQVTVTPLSFNSARSANENESMNALVPL